MKIKSFNDIETSLKPNILSLSPEKSYSLTRIKQLMKELGDPQNKIQIIHVAGTSGKTSTSYYIAEMLRLSGYKTGLSASPHVDEINERLQLDLVPLDEKIFCRELTKFLKILSKLGIKPTYFELFTAFAFWYFTRAKVDYAVMETGLGGLLDATNVVDNPVKICVITDIGSDHTEILGKSLVEIARQKAGIIQPGNAVFMHRQDKKIIKVIEETAVSNQANLKIIDEIADKISLPLYQKRNWFLAKQVSKYIFARDGKEDLPEHQYKNASKVLIPGRMDRYNIAGKEIILDGAHNQQKMQALISSLSQELNDQKICVILAVGQNKKAHLLQMAEMVSSIANKIILTSFDTEQDFKQKSIDPSYLAEYFPGLKVDKALNVERSIELALKSDESKILITGSLYLMGKVRKIIS